MRLNPLHLALIVVLLFSQAMIQAASLSKDFKNLETLYNQGKLDDLAAAVYTAKAQNDEDRALQTYLTAVLKTTKTDHVTLLQQAIDRFPNTLYGQLSMLDKAKIHILEHDIASAKTLLNRINSTSIMERYYWLAVCTDAVDDHSGTITTCENYLRFQPNGQFLEEAYYLLVNAYQGQQKFQSAISTLNKLQTLAGYPQNEQYFYYLLGYLYQLSGNYTEAMPHYKKGFELNRNSQVAFQIEDNLFELKDKYGSRIDLSFLYPYDEDNSAAPIEVSTPDTPVRPPVSNSASLRLSSKPSGGFFLQAGRFGVETNANKLTATIRGLNILANYFEDKGNKSTPWVVISGPYPTKTEADSIRQILLSNSIECFVTNF